ncbi:TetR/AcrR family transcriptional regulator [Arthrobacter sp.]|uniref:TetR/AcrR family transcriptional regulator n=1 Tax=Arthrobacter sp. TaxID=1667 RepID=UPI0026E051C9|nr:TetR/AcrR family transcriptional regulator [Arthrobacter sp.]MDO5752635.1 WHG domain-containing protein [Arthrobacter sp.]
MFEHAWHGRDRAKRLRQFPPAVGAHADEEYGDGVRLRAGSKSAGGVAALSLRDVAAGADTSTTAIYSLFGGKQELLSAVVEEGFRSFAADQHAAAPHGLLALGRAYRQWALSRPVLYSLMFPGAQQGGGPDCLPTLDFSHEAMAPLMAAVILLLEAKPGAVAPDAVAMAVWGQVQGLVSLELSGVGLAAEAWSAAYEAALSGIARAYLEN